MYDVIIIGAGPAGISRAIYASRAGLKTLVLEKEAVGGQIALTDSCENYPGNIEDLSGLELADNMRKQAVHFGAEFKYDAIKEADLEGKVKVLKSRRNVYESKAVIIATGASPRMLNVKGESEFIGRGVGFCAVCDAPFYKGSHIYVVGGGNSAADEAIYLSNFGSKVTILVRDNKLIASQIYIDKINSNEKIEVIYNTEVVEIKGEDMVSGLILRNNKTGEIKEVSEEGIGVFIFVGRIPETNIFEGQIEMENGYILADEDMKTNLDGVYVAGDVRKKKLRQVVTATSDGAIAGEACGKYLEGIND